MIHEIRPTFIDALNRNRFDALLPFGSLCELWFTGRWSNGGNGDKFCGPSFFADAVSEEWLNLETGASGRGSIQMFASAFGVDEDEAERRLRIFAKIAAPEVLPDGGALWDIHSCDDFSNCNNCGARHARAQ